MIEKQQLESIITPIAADLGCQFIGLELISQPSGPLLRVYIDKVGGVSIDECGLVSRKVGSVLDVEEDITEHYTLEVSSPGVDRLLFNPKQCEACIDAEVKVRLKSALHGQKNFKGILKAVNGDDLLIERMDDQTEVQVSFVEIEKIRLVPDLVTKR